MLSHEDDPSSSNTTECESRGAYNQHLGSAAATKAAVLASIYSLRSAASSSSSPTVFFSHTIPTPASSSSLPNAHAKTLNDC